MLQAPVTPLEFWFDLASPYSYLAAARLPALAAAHGVVVVCWHRARADAALPAVGQALRARIHQAEARGLFGAPSFWVAGDLFWGNDRLEEAVEWAVRR